MLDLIAESEDYIDWKEISEENDRSIEDNMRRWEILVKGLGGAAPGKIYKAKDMALRIKEEILTRNERYVPWTSNKNGMRNGSNKYIDILTFFR